MWMVASVIFICKMVVACWISQSLSYCQASHSQCSPRSSFWFLDWLTGFPCLLESPWNLLIFCKISMTGKVLENEYGPGKFWKLKFKVLRSHGLCLWFRLTNMPCMYRTPCVNKCSKYSCCVLTERFLCNLWWTSTMDCTVTFYI